MHQEIERLTELIKKNEKLKDLVRIKNESSIVFKTKSFSQSSFTFGSLDPQAPTLILTGGVHGLERIGAELCLSLLKTTIEKLSWDESFGHLLTTIRLVFFPLINPVGYYNYSRSNGNGVDLMRNAPVDATEKVPFLLGGQRYSKLLPWYRGQEGLVEKENQILFQKFFEDCGKSRCVVSIDFHSGFGLKDRLWFPYSKTRKPFEHLAEMHSFTTLFERTHPYHIYQIEPQSAGYLLHGDVWDYLYLQHLKNNSGTFLPLTLEMGSWMWVKKNPLQLISRTGLFNPIKAHRKKRIYRRHHILFDFVLHALHSFPVWADLGPSMRKQHQQMAYDRWYAHCAGAKL